MKFITVATAIVAFVALSSSADAACICVNRTAGRHCGESNLMSGCKRGHIYQCNGTMNSRAHEYGHCAKGCQQLDVSNDRCKP
ncbi:hypothetical protein DFQ27_003525 [Actinomortierella ambigua]|uniref:Uncharacterized protein n=1 Tax=Actinomortierella ambigua TaxID=1343610 RepID=A0A9P6Q6K4_9FUNG|nr:hypothetical protein DFQ27_003525 [Actinomortierella ambigua]